MNVEVCGRDAWVIVAAYLLGCLTAGYYLVWLRTDDDVRLTGSGSTGATNVGRVLGRPGFVVTLLWDFTKGVLAMWLARYSQVGSTTVLLALLAVVAGHIWPVQLGFRGGKGIAPCLGAWLVYDPRALLVFGLLTAAAWTVVRPFGLAGLAALAVAPLVLFLSGRFDLPIVFGFSAMGVMILIAHRRNIREELGRLWSESRARRARRGAAKD